MYDYLISHMGLAHRTVRLHEHLVARIESGSSMARGLFGASMFMGILHSTFRAGEISWCALNKFHFTTFGPVIGKVD